MPKDDRLTETSLGGLEVEEAPENGILKTFENGIPENCISENGIREEGFSERAIPDHLPMPTLQVQPIADNEESLHWMKWDRKVDEMGLGGAISSPPKANRKPKMPAEKTEKRKSAKTPLLQKSKKDTAGKTQKKTGKPEKKTEMKKPAATASASSMPKAAAKKVAKRKQKDEVEKKMHSAIRLQLDQNDLCGLFTASCSLNSADACM